jgi:tetratricopeptide (TPR) repeat protein
MRLDPLHAETYLAQEGYGYNEMGRFPEALDALRRSNQNDPMVHLSLVWIYSRLGHAQEERAEVAEVMRLSPHFSLEVYKQSVPFNWNDPRYQPFIAELRKAGLK